TNIASLFTLLSSGTGIITKFTSLFGLFGKLGSVLGLLTNPITLIIGAIVGLGAILVWMYNEFEWFRDAVHAVLGWIADAFVKLGEVILNLLSALWDGIKKAFEVGFE